MPLLGHHGNITRWRRAVNGLALDFRQFRPAARAPRARQPGKSVHCLTAVIADPIQRVDHRVPASVLRRRPSEQKLHVGRRRTRVPATFYFSLFFSEKSEAYGSFGSKDW